MKGEREGEMKLLDEMKLGNKGKGMEVFVRQDETEWRGRTRSGCTLDV